MVTASYVLYEKFRDAIRALQSWVTPAGEPLSDVMMLYASMPGNFIVVAIFAGVVVLKIVLSEQPASFDNDFPDAVEAHDLVVR